ncbi:Ig-like domain repeat protein [Thermococcus sp.]
MKKILILIIMLIIIFSIPVAAKAVERPVSRDIFLYEYFSKTLVRFEYTLRYSLQNNPYSIQLAENTTEKLGEIQLEALYYKNRGVDAKVMEVIPPFYDFSRNLEELTQLVLQFQKEPNAALAVGIQRTVESMNRDLETIDSIRLMNGTKFLNFTAQTAKIRSDLVKILKMTSSARISPKKFEISVSDIKPLLYENVTIYGSTPMNGSIEMIIAGKNSSTMILTFPKNGIFSVKYFFRKLGNYSIYAIQGNIRSNTVEITVRKIPSILLMDDIFSGLMGSTLNVSGQLVDYYGNALAHREISIGNTTLLTDDEGRFYSNYTSDIPKTMQLTVSFHGDEMHSAVSKNISIIFRRYPTSIALSGPSKAYTGRKIEFTGNMTPPLSAPLVVYLNDRPYITITAVDGSFSFFIKPNEIGKLKVYVRFRGDSIHAEAVSNVIILNVVNPPSRILRYAAMLLILALLISTFIYTRKGGEKRIIEEREEELLRPPKEKKPAVRLPDSVTELYASLRKILGISENLTPREALMLFRNTKIYGDMERITELHEKLVYGSMPLTGDEEREFRERVRRVLEGYE